MPEETERNSGGLEYFFRGMIEFIELMGNAFLSFHNWYTQNAATIAQYVCAFSNLSLWYGTVEILAGQQIVFTEDLSAELIAEINATDNVSGVIENYFFSNDAQRMDKMVSRCQIFLQSSSYTELFHEIITAYSSSHYHLACIGMFALVDGVLADFSQNSATSYRKRIRDIKMKMDNRLRLNDLDRRTLCILKSISSFDKSVFRDQYFDSNEPEDLNRHWVIHGRTHREYDRFDFLKILLWLDAIALLSEKIAE